MSDAVPSVIALEALSGPPYTAERATRAIAMCETLLRGAPDDINLHAIMGSLLSRFDRWEAALPHLARAVAAAPNHPVLQATAGLAYFHTRQFDKAAEHLLARLKSNATPGGLVLDPSNVEYAAYYGTALMHLGQFQKTAAIFDAVIRERVSFHKGRPPVPAAPAPSPQRPTRARRVHRIAYLPVEVKARELPSKVLLAAAAANAGFAVVVGASWNLMKENGADLPPGIAVFKTLNYLDAANMRGVKAAGHLIAAIDEEAFGRSADETTLRLNVHPDALAEADLVMLQGRAQRELVERLFPNTAGKLAVTGSLRADILSQTRRQPGQDLESPGYVLICLMSGNVNCSGRSFAVGAETTLGLGGIALDSTLGRSYVALFQQATASELATMPQMAELIGKVAAAFPERRVVVRPHPVEDLAYWQKAVAGPANVVLHAEGSLTDWLPGAAALVYVSGCGVGLEAYVAGVPAVRFEGDGVVATPHSGISSSLNVPARSPGEAVAHLCDMLAGAVPARTMAERDVIVATLHQADTPSAALVAAELVRLQDGHVRAGFPRDALRSFGRKRKEKFVPLDFHLRKFPRTDLEQVQRLLAQSSAILGIDRQFAVSELDTNTFLIEP